MRALVAGACLAACLLSGCSADAAAQELAGAARAFATGSPEQECGLLAPRTREELTSRSGTGCAEAIAALKLSPDATVQSVEVAGQRGQVRLRDQVLFLARFPQGWLVTDAGCTRTDPDPAVPYDCEVES